jgi:N-acetylglucosamine kinase-like BadF-type ATPase
MTTFNSDSEPQQSKLILGVDGGGTKTVASIAVANPSTGELQVLGTGLSGPGNPRSVGFDRAYANILNAISQAIELSKPIPNLRVEVGCISLAGAGRSEEQRKVREWFRSQDLVNHVLITDDIEPIRYAPRRETNPNPELWQNCVTLIAGTGSIAKLYLAQGDIYRAGGWGYLLGDEGSGFAIGLEALKRICQDTDEGRSLSPVQTEILSRLNLSQPAELVGFAYSGDLPRPQISSLASEVLAFVDSDMDAKAIAFQAIGAWATLIRQLLGRAPERNLAYGLAIGGGIATHHPWMVEELVKLLRESNVAPQSVSIVKNPVMGALQIARENLIG